MRPKIYTFSIRHPGEPAAGLVSYTETVTIVVGSGDPGGDQDDKDDPDTFLGFMLSNLQQWYEGAKIVVNPCPTCGGDGWVTGEGSHGEDTQLRCPTCGGTGVVSQNR
jgi:hypothetical protein